MLAVRKLARLGSVFQKKYFGILKAHRHASISAVKLQSSEAAGEEILQLQQKIKVLETEYKELFRENGVLRTTSLEGLDITNVKIIF